MNRLEMRATFFNLVKEVDGNNHYNTTEVNEALGRAWDNLWKMSSFNYDWIKAETVKTNGYTTVAATSTGTSLTITSPTNFADEMWVHVSDGTIYERTQIKTFDDGAAGGYVQTVSPALLHSYASGDVVYSNHLQMPTDFNKPLSVFARKIVSSVNTEQTLDWVTEDSLFKEYPYINTYGTPEKYYVNGQNLFIYPLPDAAWTFYIKYLKIPSALSDSADPEIPEHYHSLIVYMAADELLSLDRGRLNENVINRIKLYVQQGLYYMQGETRYLPCDDTPLEVGELWK